MTPIKFSQANRTIRKTNPPSLGLPDLPIHVDQDGGVTTCWKLSAAERIRLMFTGKLWHTQLTYNTPLQPCRPTTACPLITVTYDPAAKFAKGHLFKRQGDTFVKTNENH